MSDNVSDVIDRHTHRYTYRCKSDDDRTAASLRSGRHCDGRVDVKLYHILTNFFLKFLTLVRLMSTSMYMYVYYFKN